MKKTILIVAVAAVAMTSCCSQKCAKGGAQKKEMGIQLYSMRSEFGDKGYKAILKDLASWGYTSVETANYDYGKGTFYGATPEEFRKEAANLGIKVLSAHTSHNLSKEEIANHDFKAGLEWWKKAIADHKAAGMEYIVTPGMGATETLAEMKVCCEYMNEVGKLCAEAGIKYGYHNHSFEFNKIEGTPMYDYMIENTDPRYVFFEMDVYWATRGGASPVEYFKRYPGRFSLLHIKDLCTVGESGMVGFDAIFNAYETSGMENFVVEVECEPRPSVENSAKYLLNAPFVKKTYRK